MGAALDWVKALRVGLRGQNGEGWTCREIREHIQISVRFEDGQRTTVVTEYAAPALKTVNPKIK